MWNSTGFSNLLQWVLRTQCSPHVVLQNPSAGFRKVKENLSFAFKKLWGFRLFFGPFCAKCVCVLFCVSSPIAFIRMWEPRMEVSGPGGGRCLRRPAEGEGHFLFQLVIITKNHRVFTQSRKKSAGKCHHYRGLVLSTVFQVFTHCMCLFLYFNSIILNFY